MNKKQAVESRKGSFLVELSIGLVILSIIITASIKGSQVAKETVRSAKEFEFYDIFDKGIKTSFTAIVSAFEPVCSNITGSGTAQWGWGHASCLATSPLPVFDGSAGGEKIVFSINFASLGAASNQLALENSIVQSFTPYCIKSSSTATSLTLRCGNLVDLKYNLGAGLVASAHTVGTSLNPEIAPLFQITHRQRKENGNITRDVLYNGTMERVWQKRQNYSLDKINTLKTAMKVFYNTKLSAEVQNQAPDGLNSIDDEFVPWFWEVLGSVPASVSSTNCILAGGSCTNLINPDIWKSAAPTRADMWIGISSNATAGNKILSVDGFNNMLRVLPISASCTNADLSVCTDTAIPAAPAIPADNYYLGATKPPYVSIVFTEGCKNTGQVKPAYCRSYIAY